MNFFQNVLAKAKREGKLDPSLLPWEGSTWEVGEIQKAAPPAVEPEVVEQPQPAAKESFLDHLHRLPAEVLYDYQRIVENLRVMVRDSNMRIIGIASALAGQGTTTMAAVLSVLAAGPASSSSLSARRARQAAGDARYGALLVDTQLKHPSLHQIFDVPNEYGICDLLEGTIPLNVGLCSIRGYQLKLITSGKAENFQLGPLHATRFRSLMDNLREPYEFIFLDIPPVLKYADGIRLSQLCDGVVLVVGGGLMRREEVAETKAILEKAKVNVLGGILNRHKEYLPKGLSGRF